MQEVAGLIGHAATERLAAAFGGTEVYVPKTRRLSEEHPLARTIGLVAARRLAGRYSGNRLHVPIMALTKKHLIMASSGSNRAVALELGCTERWVSHVLNLGRRRSAS
jgi:hypothetical protein